MYVFVCFLGIDLGVAYGIASLGRPVAIANHSNALVFVLLKNLCYQVRPVWQHAWRRSPTFSKIF
jgi:hypothetical protein